MPGAQSCSVCLKPIASFWICTICEQVKVSVFVCSERCKRIHGRDGRHRRELRAQRG
jgi:hypothetical protein